MQPVLTLLESQPMTFSSSLILHFPVNSKMTSLIATAFPLEVLNESDIHRVVFLSKHNALPLNTLFPRYLRVGIE